MKELHSPWFQHELLLCAQWLEFSHTQPKIGHCRLSSAIPFQSHWQRAGVSSKFRDALGNFPVCAHSWRATTVLIRGCGSGALRCAMPPPKLP